MMESSPTINRLENGLINLKNIAHLLSLFSHWQNNKICFIHSTKEAVDCSSCWPVFVYCFCGAGKDFLYFITAHLKAISISPKFPAEQSPHLSGVLSCPDYSRLVTLTANGHESFRLMSLGHLHK